MVETVIRTGTFDRIGSAAPIETMRVMATLLLVSYHVVGIDTGSGMEIAFPHPLRVFADFFRDLRMPVFAFIAGYVYAIKPVRRSAFGSFISGKLRRLLIPGVIAALLFAAAQWVVKPEEAPSALGAATIPFVSYMHFWFLQAIFVIFAVYALLEAWITPRIDTLVLAGAILAFSMGLVIPTEIMSLASVSYLLPFFMLGVVVFRHLDALERWGGWLYAICVIAVLSAGLHELWHYQAHGEFSTTRDPASLAFGLGACLLLFLCLPHLPALAAFGSFSFTIYLYHVFGTAGSRLMLHALGETREVIVFAVGLGAGVAVPVAIHLVAGRTRLTRRLVLGQR